MDTIDGILIASCTTIIINELRRDEENLVE